MARGCPANTDYLEISDSANLTFPDSDWTLCVWWRSQSTVGSTLKYIFACNTWSANNSVNIWKDGSSVIAWALEDGDGTFIGDSSTSGTTEWDDTNWHVVVARRSGTTFDLFVDNSLEDTITSSAFDAVDNAAGCQFGVRGQKDTQFAHDADYAEFGKWDRALSDDEVAALRYFSPGFFVKDLVIHVPMFGIASPEPDMTGNGNSAALNGSPTRANHPPIRTSRIHPGLATVPLIEEGGGGGGGGAFGYRPLSLLSVGA